MDNANETIKTVNEIILSSQYLFLVLTKKSRLILLALAKNVGRVVPYSELMTTCDIKGCAGVQSLIVRLSSDIKDANVPLLVRTMSGVGAYLILLPPQPENSK